MLPLSLYIHVPWCVQKCPYCDFNSQKIKGQIPEVEYLQHLITDLNQDLARFESALQGRYLSSIFIGGGTPSLLQPESFAYLLQAINKRIAISSQAEITMEANPCTLNAEKIKGFMQAGINRISIGVQSFNDSQLQALGRVHDSHQAQEALALTQQLLEQGLNSFNIDLMHGLPNQTIMQALADLKRAIKFKAPHISWYQLTIEPNTAFAYNPPILPEEEVLWQIYQQGDELLRKSGYVQYETSAYALVGRHCEHNLNYWRFGDYLALGCGAFGKLSYLENGKVAKVMRFNKTKHPQGYLQGNYLHEENQVSREELAFEYFMNRFRLLEPTPKAEFVVRTGLELTDIQKPIQQALEQGYISETQDHWQVTPKGKLFLNDLLGIFL